MNYSIDWDGQDERDAPDFTMLRKLVGVVKYGRRCTRCKRIMPPGTRYEVHAYLMDGQFMNDVECVRLGDEWECPLSRPEEDRKDG